jgi:hypothetical protein
MRLAIVFILASAISAVTTFAVVRTTVCVPGVTAENPGLPIPLGPRQPVTGGPRF